jgi:hypothetical protein
MLEVACQVLLLRAAEAAHVAHKRSLLGVREQVDLQAVGPLGNVRTVRTLRAPGRCNRDLCYNRGWGWGWRWRWGWDWDCHCRGVLFFRLSPPSLEQGVVGVHCVCLKGRVGARRWRRGGRGCKHPQKQKSLCCTEWAIWVQFSAAKPGAVQVP